MEIDAKNMSSPNSLQFAEKNGYVLHNKGFFSYILFNPAT